MGEDDYSGQIGRLLRLSAKGLSRMPSLRWNDRPKPRVNPCVTCRRILLIRAGAIRILLEFYDACIEGVVVAMTMWVSLILQDGGSQPS